MGIHKVDKRKARRIKRRAAAKVRNSSLVNELNDNEVGRIFGEALFSFLNEQRHKPRFELCIISRDQGVTWTEENINVAITDPDLSTLKVGEWVKDREDETIFVVVANEGENKIYGAFQDEPDSPLYLPEGHLYRNAIN
ncbi:hypothetical protein [Paenibacillus sp. Marseille-Q7038]